MYYFFFLFVLLMSTTSGWTSAESMRSIYEVSSMAELKTMLGKAPATSCVGLDCDNTLVVDETADVYDFEMAREHARYWYLAGIAAAETNDFLGDPRGFAGHCINLTRTLPGQYRLVDDALPALNQSLWEQGIDTFVCTGLRPCEEKRDYLKDRGLNWETRFEESSHAHPLFFPGASGWLYARGNKAPALHAFVEARNKDRAVKGLEPVTDLYFVDNHLETLQDIDRVFSHGDIKLHLIHWRKHALDLAREHEEGSLIPRIVEGYKVLVAPPLTQLGESDDGYHSPSPYESCGYDTGSPLCSPVRFEVIMSSPLRPAAAN